MSNALLLLADSQLLFRPEKAPALHQRFKRRFPQLIEAAYIGAANDNDPAFYDLACQAVNTLVGRKCNTHFICSERRLPQEPCPLVILAGGSVSRGWQLISKPEIRQWLERCRALPNSVMVGVSAGAIHLTNGVDPDQPTPVQKPYLNWLPLPVAVHEEQQGWPSLVAHPALGIPMGGGVWVDGTTEEYSLEAVGNAGFRSAEDGNRQTLLALA